MFPVLQGLLTMSFAMATQKFPMMPPVIALLETARANKNNLTFNAKKFVFKSQDCPFIGGSLTPNGYKIGPKKVQAVIEMKAPQNLQDLQSYLGLVNYLNRFIPKLADLKAPLRALCKKDTVYA